MNTEDLITIKEYAAAKNISRQAVYKQLSTKLSEFTVKVDGKTYLKRAALDKGVSTSSDNQVDKNDNRADNQVDNSKPSVESEAFLMLLEMMKQEIAKKDDEIKDLRDKLDHAYSRIGELAEQAHYITAADKTAQIMEKQEESEREKTELQSVNQELKETPKKRNFFNFFKKKV